MIVDSVSGHKIAPKSNIEFLFLPPNCTSCAQPLDMGVSKSFRDIYRRLLNNFLISMSLDEGLEYKETIKKVSLLQVVKWVEKSLILLYSKQFIIHG